MRPRLFRWDFHIQATCQICQVAAALALFDYLWFAVTLPDSEEFVTRDKPSHSSRRCCGIWTARVVAGIHLPTHERHEER